jgi:hypothetical protein
MGATDYSLVLPIERIVELFTAWSLPVNLLTSPAPLTLETVAKTNAPTVTTPIDNVLALTFEDTLPFVPRRDSSISVNGSAYRVAEVDPSLKTFKVLGRGAGLKLTRNGLSLAMNSAPSEAMNSTRKIHNDQ